MSKDEKIKVLKLLLDMEHFVKAEITGIVEFPKYIDKELREVYKLLSNSIKE